MLDAPRQDWDFYDAAVRPYELERLRRMTNWTSAVHEQLTNARADAAGFLRSHNVPFAVTGGIASSIRGEPRVTSDVDLVIGTDVAGALQLLYSLEGSPFEPLFRGADEVVERSFILPVKHRASGVRVDMAIGLSEFEKDAIGRAQTIQMGSKVSAPVVSIEDPRAQGELF
jgi:hypothetical protein